jgi:hypothetical protein
VVTLREAVIIFLAILTIGSGCLSTPVVDKEKAGYIAVIRFQETQQITGSPYLAPYTVRDPGGDAYAVYFNITSAQGEQIGFAEYYVDKYTRDIYVSPNFGTSLAIEQSDSIKRVFNRYPEAKIEPNLIKTESPTGNQYIWDITVIANGVRTARFGYDAVNEKVLSESFLQLRSIDINTGENR